MILLLCWVCSTLVIAAVPTLADAPFFDPVTVPPNVFVAFDNSRSMMADHPDNETAGFGIGTSKRDFKCYSNPVANSLWYDPKRTYTRPYSPWPFHPGNVLPDITDYTFVRLDGYANNSGTGTSWGFANLTSSTGFNTMGNTTGDTDGGILGSDTAAGWAGSRLGAGGNGKFPFYNNYTGGGSAPTTCTGSGTSADSNYTTVYIDPSVASYSVGANRSDCGGSTCTYAQEIKNFAIWFSYYRTRFHVLKGALGFAAAKFDQDTRLGLMSFILDPANIESALGYQISVANQGMVWRQPASFTSGVKENEWYYALYRQRPGANLETYQQKPLGWIGELLRTKYVPGTSDRLTPDSILPAGSGGECQRHYSVLLTESYWAAGDQAASYSEATTTDWDTTIPNHTRAGLPGDPRQPGSPELLNVLRKQTGNQSLNAGDYWPAPYRLGSSGDGVGNTLADVAMYYWMTDLRQTNDGFPTLDNLVPTTTDDPANWQHLTTYGVAFGIQGAGSFVDTNGDGLPDNLPSSWPYSSGGSSAWKFDDLWHAAVNGRGKFFSANNFDSLRRAISGVFSDIGVRQTSGASAGVGAADFSALGASDLIFTTSYKSGAWFGDVVAKQIDLYSGTIKNDNVWKDVPTDHDGAVRRIGNQFSGTNWQNRIIITKGSSGAVSIENAPSSQLNTLKRSGDTYTSTQFINYLRGDRSNEKSQSGGIFRARNQLLGDIVNANPVFVGPVIRNLRESNNPGFSAFADLKASRAGVVYVGGNDGMLHAINAPPAPTNATDIVAEGGKELWAYVPSQFFREDSPSNTGLRNLGLPADGTAPNQFQHRYYVDGRLFAANVDFNNSSAATRNWRTILVGGLGKGGNGYFALDVTEPTAADASAAASKFLWEFNPSASANVSMGYSYGSPIAFRIRSSDGKTRWVVAVASGYNNSKGKGHVWLLNPETGDELYRFDVTGGSGSDPINLGHINAFMPDAESGIADSIYASDMQGNIWRMDLNNLTLRNSLSDPIPNDNLNKPLASFGSNNPFTSPPVITRSLLDPLGARWVVAGSGRLLAASDKSVTGPYSLFAFKDGTVNAPSTIGSTPIGTTNLTQITPTDNPTTEPSIGWQMTLPNKENVTTGPIIASDPTTNDGTVVIVQGLYDNGSTDPCRDSLSGNLYLRDLNFGASVIDQASVPAAGGFTAVMFPPLKADGTINPAGGLGILIQNRDGSTSRLSTTRRTVRTMNLSIPRLNQRIIYP